MFNNGYSKIYAYGSLYDIATCLDARFTNTNNGKNYELIETTFGNLNVGDMFVRSDDMDKLEDLYNYNIKCESDCVCIDRDRPKSFKLSNNYKVYKVTKLK